jgi:hypothetical protein
VLMIDRIHTSWEQKIGLTHFSSYNFPKITFPIKINYGYRIEQK